MSDNHIHDIASVGIYVDAYENNQSNIHAYNNTIYNISGVGISVASEEGGHLENVIINNNVVHHCNDRAMVIHWTNKPDYIIKNIYVLHNTFVNNNEGIDVGVHALGENINIDNNICSQNISYQIQNSSSDLNPTELKVKNNLLYGINPSWALYGDSYITDNPLFIDGSIDNFHLQSTSPAINQGMHVTKTVNSGTSAIVQLEDAGFFTNGYGMNEGDIIQFEGQTQQFKILEVDYVTNTITLNNVVSYTNGDGVSLKYIEDTPDMGAFEYDSFLGLYANNLESLTIFPNPTKDIFYVSNKYLNCYYQIISLTGSVIKNGRIEATGIHVSEINAGVYFFRIIDKISKMNRISKWIKNN